MYYSSKISSYVLFPVNGLDLKPFLGKGITNFVFWFQFHIAIWQLELLQVSFFINKQEGRGRRKEKGKESGTCGLRFPKTRLGINLLNFN